MKTAIGNGVKYLMTVSVVQVLRRSRRRRGRKKLDSAGYKGILNRRNIVTVLGNYTNCSEFQGLEREPKLDLILDYVFFPCKTRYPPSD